MPALLSFLVVFGLAAVVAGNFLVQTAKRRAAQGPLAFVDAPPAGVAPEGTTLPGLAGVSRAPARAPRAPVLRRVRSRVRQPGSSFWLFVASFAVYVTIGGILVLHYGSIVGDAQSRVADGWYVFFSRDPHLAAIGFVWNPLPSIFVMPLFLFKDIWPALTQRAFAGNIMSAVFMAGCVVQLRAILRELSTRRAVLVVLVVAFALNPMVVYYGANGMSEAFYLFFLLVGVRYLVVWLRTRRTGPLVASACAMGFGYLTRYESGAAALTAIAVVAVASFARARGSRKERLRLASCDTLVFAVPPAAAFIGWSIVSYVITGHAFEQFSSQYGNSSQVGIVGKFFTAKALGMPLPVFGGYQVLAYAPLLPFLLVGACAVAWTRRDPRVLGLFLLAGTVAFSYLAFVGGGAFPWLRFYIPGLPLSLCCIAILLSPAPAARGRPVPLQFASATVAVIVAVALVVPAAVTTALAMNDPRLGSGERESLAWVLWGPPENPSQQTQKAIIASAQAIARDIDARNLPSSAIVADTFSPCVSLILMNSKHPHQFVITSDRDYQRVLADPPTFKAHYLLVPPTGGYGGLDAINRAYPHLYSGSLVGTRELKTYHEVGCPKLKLFRVNAQASLGR